MSITTRDNQSIFTLLSHHSTHMFRTLHIFSTYIYDGGWRVLTPDPSQKLLVFSALGGARIPRPGWTPVAPCQTHCTLRPVAASSVFIREPFSPPFLDLATAVPGYQREHPRSTSWPKPRSSTWCKLGTNSLKSLDQSAIQKTGLLDTIYVGQSE